MVGVELLDARIDVAVAFTGVEVEAEPAEEDEFTTGEKELMLHSCLDISKDYKVYLPVVIVVVLSI